MIFVILFKEDWLISLLVVPLVQKWSFGGFPLPFLALSAVGDMVVIAEGDLVQIGNSLRTFPTLDDFLLLHLAVFELLLDQLLPLLLDPEL